MPLNRPILTTFALLSILGFAGCNSTTPIQTQIERPAPSPTPVAEVEEAWIDADVLAGLSPWPIPEERAGSSGSEAIDDLWDRIRDNYQLHTPQKTAIDTHVSWFARHPKHLQRVRDRAAPYLHFIVEEIERRGLPGELALLPVVESAYRPFAYSAGRAAGIWQFIPSTGRLYKLKQNWWYDGRRDVVAATHAALDFLEAMAKQFDGDWELALAAYNAGIGNVSRAIKRNRKRGKPTDFWSLDLPRETRGYVPRLMAVAKVIGDPHAYGLELSPVADRPYFESVDIQSQIDLALAAEMADISIEELYRLNPGFNRWASPPEGPHRLNLPVAKVEGFKSELAALDPEKRLRWKRYKIRNGDSLGVIARKHHTTVSLLRQINKLKGNRIRAGKHLLIPVSSQGLEAYTHSKEQRQAKILKRKGKGVKVIHHVKSGDTLWDIARHYNVGHKSLARWNGISPRDTLRLGQKLVVWTKRIETASAAPVGLMPGTTPFDTRSKVSYRVRSGDSLARIAQKFRVSVSDLKRWNSFSNKYLQPGQRINLYVDVTAQAL